MSGSEAENIKRLGDLKLLVGPRKPCQQLWCVDEQLQHAIRCRVVRTSVPGSTGIPVGDVQTSSKS